MVATSTILNKIQVIFRQSKSYNLLIITLFFLGATVYAQDVPKNSTDYTPRVLETTEIDFLSSYYSQDGNNAAVTGGLGTEELTDVTAAFIISIPLSDDDILTIDTGISAYTSASSSNINPFDKRPADPFTAATGASRDDTWYNLTAAYSKSSDDRNTNWSAKVSFSTEYDYSSFGFGGSYSKLLNEKNTEISINANVFLDKWNAIYPYELRPFAPGGLGLDDFLFRENTITGNPDYDPDFTVFSNEKRNSYALGLSLSQIISKNIQGSFLVDLVQQNGLLSTPFQRVYFEDVEDSFIDNFHLADDIERLPDKRFKVALGTRVNFYINEFFVLRSFYRFYTDDWGITSHTASLEIPIKIVDKWTLYPAYRFYYQSSVDYFAFYNQHNSQQRYYTSDFDLSQYSANQYGIGVNYTDIFTRLRLWKIGLKSIDLRYNYYHRNTGLSAGIISGGLKFQVQ